MAASGARGERMNVLGRPPLEASFAVFKSAQSAKVRLASLKQSNRIHRGLLAPQGSCSAVECDFALPGFHQH